MASHSHRVIGNSDGMPISRILEIIVSKYAVRLSYATTTLILTRSSFTIGLPLYCSSINCILNFETAVQVGLLKCHLILGYRVVKKHKP